MGVVSGLHNFWRREPDTRCFTPLHRKHPLAYAPATGLYILMRSTFGIIYRIADILRYKLSVFAIAAFCKHACGIKFVGINVRGTCLISENHEHFIPTKITCYTVFCKV